MAKDLRATHPGQLTLPLFDEPPPAPQTHPAADPARDNLRTAVLLGEVVRYRFRRAGRKTIGFSIDDDGLSISAPRWVRLADVDEALQEKARWILRKLQEQRERREQLAARRIDWRDGAALPFMGSDIRLKLDAHAVDTLFEAEVRLLRLPLAQDADAQQIRDRVQAWLQRQAKRVFDERVALFAERLRVQVREVKLSSASTRWGTASADGLIRLNWRLIHFALPVIDYVCAHEVAHLREMHHGPAFWATVRSIFPEFEDAKAQLKDEALPRFED
jgi:predicted metal-dependent hydrolase